jgi:para-aminobenzoate synthetase component 2
MLLLIDNYDSFVHNLARYFERLGQATSVVRNDRIDIEGVRRLQPRAIVLSPGPCTPREAGVSLEIVAALYQEYPILGVCLGHQVIAEALGATVTRARVPIHGQASLIQHDGLGLFEGIGGAFHVGRYHSLIVEPNSLPNDLLPTARTGDNVLMAFRHTLLPVFGVQFHPESILTEHGYTILANFLKHAGMASGKTSIAASITELDQPLVPTSSLPNGPVTF